MPEGIVAFDRVHGAERLRVLLNLTPEHIAVALVRPDGGLPDVLRTSGPGSGRPLRDSIQLDGDVGVVIRRG